MNKVIATVWICDDGVTIRAGDRSLCLWWDVGSEDEGQDICALLNMFTRSEADAIFDHDVSPWETVRKILLTSINS